MDTEQHIWRLRVEIRRIERLCGERQSYGAVGDAALLHDYERTIAALAGARDALRLLQRAYLAGADS